MRALAFALTLALAGCPTVPLGEAPADIASCKPDKAYFTSAIWPDYIQRTDAPDRSCVDSECHAPGGNGGALHFEIDPVDNDANYQRATGSRLNCGTPEESELLTKPLGAFGHKHVFPADSDEVLLFLSWFDQ